MKNKKEFVYEGPFLNDKRNVERFRDEHKNTFEKNRKIYAREKITANVREFLEKWKDKYYLKIKEMSISEMKVID